MGGNRHASNSVDSVFVIKKSTPSPNIPAPGKQLKRLGTAGPATAWVFRRCRPLGLRLQTTHCGWRFGVPSAEKQGFPSITSAGRGYLGPQVQEGARGPTHKPALSAVQCWPGVQTEAHRPGHPPCPGGSPGSRQVTGQDSRPESRRARDPAVRTIRPWGAAVQA